jgi:hypothetical protein
MNLKDHKETPEYIKSGYLLRLTDFIEWPPTVFNFSMSPFMLGLYGDHYIESALFDTFRDRRIKERDWKAEFYESQKKIYHCHLLFIMKTESQELINLIQHLSRKKVLTVGDNIENFCQMGGIINLVGTHPNYGYEINQNALATAGLVASKELLELATPIE